ncbi:MAG: hypothetical protein AMXMBFR34_39110 [Myxococcaceae bacterium]
MLAVVFLAGCTGAQLPANTVEEYLGSAGGQVLNVRGSGVSVPAGALSQAVAIRVGPAPATQPAPAVVMVGDMVLFAPEGQTFSKPVTVTLEVDPLRLPPGRPLTDVVVWTAPLGSSQWEVLPTRLVDAAHVEATTTHFSVFVPVVQGATRGGDGGEDGGLDGGSCVDECSGGGDGGSDGGGDCECHQECGGETLEIICSGDTQLGCACVRNGVQVGVVTLNACPGPGELEQACGFGSDGGFDGGGFDAGVDAGVDGGFDGGTDGGRPDAGDDGGGFDGGFDGGTDGGRPDSGVDGGGFDGGFDGGTDPDAGVDGGGFDGGLDGGRPDAGDGGGGFDAGTPDAGADGGG